MIFFLNKNLDNFLFVFFIIGLIFTHIDLRYLLIFPISFLIFLKYFFTTKIIEFNFSSFDYFFFFLFFLNIIFQLYFNNSVTTLQYSFVLIGNFILYKYLNILKIERGFIFKAVLALSILFLFHLSIFDKELQYKSFLLNANSLAATILLLFYLVELTGEKINRVLYSLIVLLIYINLIESRAFLLSIIFYFVFLILFSLNLKKTILFLISFIFIFYYLLFDLYVSDNTFLTRILSILNIDHLKIFGSDILYSAHRNELWKIVVDKTHNIYFGNGFGTSNDLIKEFYGKGYSPHNTYLKIYTEGGLFFLISYLLFLIFMIIKSKSKITKSFIIAIHIRMFFESAFPFGLSLQSSLLVLPFYLEQIFYEKKNYISHTRAIR
jgi:hypothetical protein